MRGKNNPMWKGGAKMHSEGYVYVRQPNNTMADVAGYVLEHRLIMSKHIGRDLLDNEVVHHLNHNKSDNRIENLALLVDQAEHLKEHGYLLAFRNLQSSKNRVNSGKALKGNPEPSR